MQVLLKKRLLKANAPSPHVEPCGLGFTKSSTAVLAPSAAASFDAAKPPLPPPMTTRSYS